MKSRKTKPKVVKPTFERLDSDDTDRKRRARWKKRGSDRIKRHVALLTAEYPADDEIEQDTVNEKEQVGPFATGEATHKKAEKILTPPKLVAFCSKNSGLILLMAVVFLSLGDVVLDKHHSTKDLEPFSYFQRSDTFEIQVDTNFASLMVRFPPHNLKSAVDLLHQDEAYELVRVG